jgi:hypothetical protein
LVIELEVAPCRIAASGLGVFEDFTGGIVVVAGVLGQLTELARRFVVAATLTQAAAMSSGGVAASNGICTITGLPLAASNRNSTSAVSAARAGEGRKKAIATLAAVRY